MHLEHEAGLNKALTFGKSTKLTDQSKQYIYDLQLFILSGIEDKFTMSTSEVQKVSETIGTKIFFFALNFILIKSRFCFSTIQKLRLLLNK